MPTTRRRIKRQRAGVGAHLELSPCAIARLYDQPAPADTAGDPWPWTSLRDDDAEAVLWAENRVAVLRGWPRERPGTRPSLWWRYDAPEPARKRLGGIGTADLMGGLELRLVCGIPTTWVSEFQVAYYTGKAVDIHGNPIGRTDHAGNPRTADSFDGVALDPADPPLFESQAVYLDRHGLLTPAERKRLSEADFAPEAVAASA